MKISIFQEAINLDWDVSRRSEALKLSTSEKRDRTRWLLQTLQCRCLRWDPGCLNISLIATFLLLLLLGFDPQAQMGQGSLPPFVKRVSELEGQSCGLMAGRWSRKRVIRFLISAAALTSRRLTSLPRNSSWNVSAVKEFLFLLLLLTFLLL